MHVLRDGPYCQCMYCEMAPTAKQQWFLWYAESPHINYKRNRGNRNLVSIAAVQICCIKLNYESNTLTTRLPRFTNGEDNRMGWPHTIQWHTIQNYNWTVGSLTNVDRVVIDDDNTIFIIFWLKLDVCYEEDSCQTRVDDRYVLVTEDIVHQPINSSYKLNLSLTMGQITWK